MTADDWAWPRREPVPMTPETLIKTVGAKNGTVPVEVALRAVRMARSDAAADSLRSRAAAVREQAAGAGADTANLDDAIGSYDRARETP